jgi:uncharacterized protein (DUF427 family)
MNAIASYSSVTVGGDRSFDLFYLYNHPKRAFIDRDRHY